MNVYLENFIDGITPVPSYNVSVWASEKRILSGKSSSAGGRWRNSVTPYLVEPMDCLSPHSLHEEIVFMGPAQCGKTEIGLNWLGSIIDVNPGPTMIVQPTTKVGAKFSKQRLASMIEDTPCLSDKVKDSKSRDSGNTILTKEFKGGLVTIASAESPSELRSMPAKNLWFDEPSSYPADCGGEGCPVRNASKRTNTFHNKKILHTSTPLDRSTCRITRAYERGDQRKYFVPCPHCHKTQYLQFKNLSFERTMDYELIEPPCYVCEHCDGKIRENEKSWMLKHGVWKRTDGQTTLKKIASFWLNALNAPVGWLSWSEIVEEFLQAKKKKDPALLKSWTNTILAEAWEDNAGELVDDKGLYSRREDYDCVPLGVGVIFAGVDVQKDRIEAEAVGYGVEEESWGIEYRVFIGYPSEKQVWIDLDNWLRRTYVNEKGVHLGISGAFVDSGGHHAHEVYSFVKPRAHRNIFAIKGSNKTTAPAVSKPSINNSSKVPLFFLGVSSIKENIFYKLKISDVGAGYMHFPKSYDSEYFRQLTAEKLVVKYKRGGEIKEWVKQRKRNEALDCRVYSYGLLVLMRPDLKAWVASVQECKPTITPRKKLKAGTIHPGIS